MSYLILQGSPQWITIDFEESIVPVELCIQFQGGFAGADCWVEGKMDASSSWEKIDYFYPEDKNSLQVSLNNFVTWKRRRVLLHIFIVHKLYTCTYNINIYLDKRNLAVSKLLVRLHFLAPYRGLTAKLQ
jgi:hypothetical protein